MNNKNKRIIHQQFVGAIIALLLLLWQFMPINTLRGALERLDGIIYDYRLTMLPAWPDSVANIQIVDIDETSLEQFGRMPWPRKLFADLTRLLTRHGAIVIVFDILFSEPEANAADSVLALLTNTEVRDKVQSIAPMLDGDTLFGQSLQQNEVVLATLFHQEKQIAKGVLPSGDLLGFPPSDNHKLHRFSGYSANIEKLANHAVGQGFVNVVPDRDGFIRRAPLVVTYQGSIYPSLALDAFRAYSFAERIELEWQPPQNSVLSAIKIGQTRIPTDKYGQLLIPYRQSSYYYPYTSAADVLASRINDDRFNNSIVFVGTSAIGLADLRTTPVGMLFPGVEIHATVLDALMSPDTIPFRPDWWQGAVFFILITIAIVLILVLPRLGAVKSECFALGILLLIISINLSLWRWYAIDLPLTSSITMTLVLSGYFISYGYLSENKLRTQVKAIFDRYVSPTHIEEMLAHPEVLNLKGQSKFLTVLYADIRDFTRLSESLSPQQLTLWLNRVFSPLTREIFKHQGTIDKYVGDMVMAFWGAPLHDAEQANHAIATAFAMQMSLVELNKQFKAEGLPSVSIGIGINSGMMNVGDMGSEYRLSYTVLGDAANLGSRIESLTKFYGVPLLISEFTRSAVLNEPNTSYAMEDFVLIDKVYVKGKSTPVTLYLPLSPLLDAAERQVLNCFNQVLTLYFSAKFLQANQGLAKISDQFPYQLLRDVYLKRIKHLIKNPPESNWNGVYKHSQK